MRRFPGAGTLEASPWSISKFFDAVDGTPDFSSAAHAAEMRRCLGVDRGHGIGEGRQLPQLLRRKLCLRWATTPDDMDLS